MVAIRNVYALVLSVKCFHPYHVSPPPQCYEAGREDVIIFIFRGRNWNLEQLSNFWIQLVLEPTAS